FYGYADAVRLCKLSCPVDDWRERHGVPAIECIQLLDLRVWRSASVLQLLRRKWTLRRRFRARRRLVRVRAPHRKGLLARSQHRLLDARGFPKRDRIHWNCTKRRNNYHLYALQRHEDDPPAASGLALPCDVLHGFYCCWSTYGRADHADSGPLCRLPLFRYPGRWLSRFVDALLLDLRPPGGLHFGVASVRVRQRDRPRLLPQGRLWLSGDGCGLDRDRLHQSQCVGTSYVHCRPWPCRQYLLRLCHHGHLRPDGNQDLQLVGDHLGWRCTFRRPYDVLHWFPISVPHCRPHRHHAFGCSL